VTCVSFGINVTGTVISLLARNWGTAGGDSLMASVLVGWYIFLSWTELYLSTMAAVLDQRTKDVEQELRDVIGETRPH
jgi:hypothetical protein